MFLKTESQNVLNKIMISRIYFWKGGESYVCQIQMLISQKSQRESAGILTVLNSCPFIIGRTRLSNSSKYILQSQICRTNTFQSSYYNRVVKVWNIVCKDVCLNTVSSPNTFKCLVKRIYSSIVDSIYDVNLSCTWSLFRDCSCHRA